MTKQEEAFWDYYEQISKLADKHQVSVYELVNFRQIFDFAYLVGKSDGIAEVSEIFEKGKK